MRLPNLINLTAGCYRLTEHGTGKIWHVGNAALVEPSDTDITELADILTDFGVESLGGENDVVSGDLTFNLPTGLPAGIYEATIFSVAAASVTSTTAKYGQVIFALGSDSLTVIKWA